MSNTTSNYIIECKCTKFICPEKLAEAMLGNFHVNSRHFLSSYFLSTLLYLITCMHYNVGIMHIRRHEELRQKL